MQTEQIISLMITERDRLSRAIDALQRPARRGAPAAVRSTKPAGKKRQISAAGRKAIADAARRRWAAIRTAKAAPKEAVSSAGAANASVANPATKGRQLSPAARKAMGDAARRRWAAAKKIKNL